MKQLLILLLSISCFGQEKMHLTAYRLIHLGDDDPDPCSVTHHFKSESLLNVFTCNSDDQDLIVNLLRLKTEVPKKWKKTRFSCEDYASNVGIGIHNIFVIYDGTKHDTLFTTEKNDFIIFPTQHAAYKDEEGALKKLLTPDLKAFFARNFETEVFRTEIIPKDTITQERIIYRKVPLSFNAIKGYSSIDITISEPEPYEKAPAQNMLWLFEKNEDTNGHETRRGEYIEEEYGFVVDGIKIGDNEDILFEKYPVSTKHQMPLSTKYEEIKTTYSYILCIKSDVNLSPSYLYIGIRNKKIVGIAMQYYWY